MINKTENSEYRNETTDTLVKDLVPVFLNENMIEDAQIIKIDKINPGI